VSRLPTPDEWARVKREASAADTEGIQAVSIPEGLAQAIIATAREGRPNEACGLLVAQGYAASGAAPHRWVALTNAAASPYRYFIDPEEQLRVWMEIDDADEVVWGIVHSHVASPARPSATDVGLAYYPDSLYLICSLADPEKPDLRAWSIRDGVVSELTLTIGD
jgi:[CysO sulfur-carrier protein]-S-L-cysteine hydrolase